jgi:pilus assembly protein Flp/PilA
MRFFLRKSLEFLWSEDGPTAVEYAVMLAFIIIVCISIITALGSSVSSSFAAANGAFS